ncbi:hypothetical protein [Paenibacillus terrigena]|uniref:hypothetical protein n=1 Tax=Paenibacillus terrigena TaxID=369333 RepID=UPI000379BA58|nr:hypothetical protein [Paenibacillus terrigena]
MASKKINVPQCPVCGDEGGGHYFRRCTKCHRYYTMVTRDKKQVSGDFTVVDWFSSRSSAGLILEDSAGKRYPIYMSDVFRFINGLNFGQLMLEETKKGSAYGWCVVNNKEAVN